MLAERIESRIIGEVLRELRQDLGYGPSDVLARIPIVGARPFRRGALGSWERGERAVSVQRLLDLCAIYETDPAHVLSIIESRAAAEATA